MKLPPEDHVYGFQVKKDPEGVDTSKSFLIFNYIFIVYFSYKKLEDS